MSVKRVASRYAKSLLELADEKGVLDSVYQDMLLVTQLCQQNRDFALMLRNPIIPNEKKIAILRQVFEEKVHPISLAFFDILARKNRENLLQPIASEFQNQYFAHKGIIRARVVTAVPLDENLKNEFMSKVKQISKKDVDLTEVVDENIIGGYELTIGDLRLDDSVKSKLNQLTLEFQQNRV